jgi:hypothetical protein
MWQPCFFLSVWRKNNNIQYFVANGQIVYCYTICTRQSIVEREGLEHDERSEEFNMSCATSVTCYFFLQRDQQRLSLLAMKQLKSTDVFCLVIRTD